MTQEDRILDYMRERGRITTADAMYELGVASLQKRLSDLRKKGYVITKEWESSKNRYGENCSYMVYRLVEDGN